MSRPAQTPGGDNLRRPRSNTATTTTPPSPFTRPSYPKLARSKSVNALSRPVPSHREWAAVPAVPAERVALTRARSGSAGNTPSGGAPPPPPKDTRQPRMERAKTLGNSAHRDRDRDRESNRELPTGGTGSSGGAGTSGGGSGGGSLDSHTSTFTSIAAKVRPKLASLTNLRRSKSYRLSSHRISKSVSSSPSTSVSPDMPFIVETPEEPVPPLPAPFARLVPRAPVVRRSISLYDVKGELKPSLPSFSPSTTLPSLPPKFSGKPREPERTPSHRGVGASHSRVEKHKETPGPPHPATLPGRTGNRHATVYAPAPSVPLSSSSTSRPSKHLVKPSLSLTLPNGISVVHQPLLLSPISTSFRPNTAPITPPSRPPPRALLPESPLSFNFGLDIKPEAWDAPPSASLSVASYYYTATEATIDYRDVITKYIEFGDMESVRSLDIRNHAGWSAPHPHLKAPHPRPGTLTSPAQLLPLDRRSALPTPEPIGDGKFPPLPPPPVYNKKLPATPTPRDDEQYAEETSQIMRLRRAHSYRSRTPGTPGTPDTPPLLTPNSNMPLPALVPWRAEESTNMPNQDVAIVARQPSLKLRSKRTLQRPATGF